MTYSLALVHHSLLERIKNDALSVFLAGVVILTTIAGLALSSWAWHRGCQ